MKKLNIKKKSSKRLILILSNCIFLFFAVIACFNYMYRTSDIGHYQYALMDIFCFSLIQCVFTFFSLVVYYLSIMSDALNRKYKEEVKDKENKK